MLAHTKAQSEPERGALLLEKKPPWGLVELDGSAAMLLHQTYDGSQLGSVDFRRQCAGGVRQAGVHQKQHLQWIPDED